MKKQTIIFIASLCSIVLLGVYREAVTSGNSNTVIQPSQAKVTLGAPEIPVKSTQGAEHPDIEDGVACNDCHEVKLDGKTSATQVWLYGDYLQWSSGEGIMPKERAWQQVVTLLGGKKVKRTYVLATSLNNRPFVVTVDGTLDPEKKVLYVFSEKGTAKLDHIRNNPHVSLNWHKEFKNFSHIQCLQITGSAELFSGEDPEYDEGLTVYEFEYAADARKVPVEKWKDIMKQSMLMQRITVSEVTFIDSTLRGSSYRSQQRWTR